MIDSPGASSPVRSAKPGITGTKVICILYVGFILIWSVGLALGLLWTGPEQPRLYGLPVWFLVGCIISSVLVSVALVLCLRRWFQ